MLIIIIPSDTTSIQQQANNFKTEDNKSRQFVTGRKECLKLIYLQSYWQLSVQPRCFASEVILSCVSAPLIQNPENIQK